MGVRRGRSGETRAGAAPLADEGAGAEEIPFEAAIEELEALVGRIEAGDLALEESLAAFERGVRLVRQCAARLDAAEIRIRELELGPEGPRDRPLDLENDR